jgi:hypothetical protein
VQRLLQHVKVAHVIECILEIYKILNPDYFTSANLTCSPQQRQMENTEGLNCRLVQLDAS